MNGFIALYWKLLQWLGHDASETLSVFAHLLLLANWRDTEWRGVLLKRGQLITSRAHLAKLCGLTERKVRTALTRLISTGEVTSKATSQYTVITIVNYSLYQNFSEKNDQPDDQHSDQLSTSDRPATDHSLIMNNQVNKEEIPAGWEDSEAWVIGG